MIVGEVYAVIGVIAANHRRVQRIDSMNLWHVLMTSDESLVALSIGGKALAERVLVTCALLHLDVPFLVLRVVVLHS